MITRNIPRIRCSSARRFSRLAEEKISWTRRKQEKELKRLELQSEKISHKEITTELSDVRYEGKSLPGEKKDITCQLPQKFSSKFVEACWYDWWERKGFFKPKTSSNNGVFSMVIPPPNVTGKLHLGHALTVALEDVLCRWNRMRGREVVWVPGCDHAGIATQAVVEKLLLTKNISRHELGRDEFLKEVGKWKDSKEEEIYDQLRVLGASLDWTRTNFTLSPKFSRAVQEAFIRLHDEGIIYRKKSLVNWSCQLQSTISDIEINNKTIDGPTMIPVPGYKKNIEFGVLYTFAYPLMDPSADLDSISVSTTRIETMLGDTAIAVNPDDTRHSCLVGRHVSHPLLPDVTLPIIADSTVDKDFGTGAVKITPAHDARDFDMGTRHNLEYRNILDDKGCITNTGRPDFDGLPRFEAREKVIQALDQAGLYRGKKPHVMNLPLCSRSGDIIEPRMKTQWFISIKNLAQRAIDAVETGEIRLEPNSYRASWKNWLSTSDDWCVSRQLWWGHRIPAYKITNSDGDLKWISAHSEEEARQKAEEFFKDASLTLAQDEDVLDTWFSSALFPFAVFGWPENNRDLERYYPLSIMETGYDLIFFWVAKMTMLGIALTGKVPFETVYLHTMVRDSQGRKMSKSLGNVIDPLEVINGCSPEDLDNKIKNSNLSKKEEKYALKDRAKTLPHGIAECGTDALRFYLCFNKSIGKDISLDVHNVLQYRYFCNKIWNAFAFLVGNISRRDRKIVIDPNHLRPVDFWIQSRLTATIDSVNTGLENFNFAIAAFTLHQFFLVDFADFYLESCKPVFNDQSPCNTTERLNVESNFEFIFESFLRLLSPFMPYITEELWQRLPNNTRKYESVMIAEYPTVKMHCFRNADLESDIDKVRDVNNVIRHVRQMFNLSNKVLSDVIISSPNSKDLDALSHNLDVIKTLAKCGSIKLSSSDGIDCEGYVSNSVPDTNITVHLDIKGVIDAGFQVKTLSAKRDSVFDKILRLEKKIENTSSEKTLSLSKEKLAKARQVVMEMDKIIEVCERLNLK